MHKLRPIMIAVAIGFGLMQAEPAHAFWGLLGKLGSLGGKTAPAAGAAAKGAGAAGTAAKGAAVVVGVDAVLTNSSAMNAANALSKTGKVGTAVDVAELSVVNKAATAEELSKAAGLGKAVPDEVLAMLTTRHKKLADVPDLGARQWLELNKTKVKPGDAELMIRDYATLLEGKAAMGPEKLRELHKPTKVPDYGIMQNSANEIPWYAFELLARAGHFGSKFAQGEFKRVCNTWPKDKPMSPECSNALK